MSIGTDRDLLRRLRGRNKKALKMMLAYMVPRGLTFNTEIKKKTALYRHYDVDHNLLYVGVSISAIGRWINHRCSSKWVTKSVRMDIEWHDSRECALEAEKEAIKKESPLFNINGK